MRYLFLLLGSWFWMAPNGQAQQGVDTSAQEWVNYIIGKPYMEAIDAHKAVAKEWGIRYRIVLSGCETTEQALAEAQAYQQSNQRYFAILDQRYGADWQTYFKREVAKQQSFLQQQTRPLQGTWYELIAKELDQPHLTPRYLEAKAAVAAEWGIRYAPLYLDEIQNEAQNREAEAKSNQSYAYAQQITQQLGDPYWIEWIAEEATWRLLQASTPAGGPWQDPVWGHPDTLYYSAKAAVAARWNIAYQPVYLGTQRTAPSTLPKANGAYFALLGQHFKGNWWSHFYRNVAKEYWWRRLGGVE